MFIYFGSQWLKINPSHTFSRYFASPKPELAIIQQNVDRLRHGILECLRHKSPEQRITMEFRHDVFKYLFHSKGRKSPEKNWTLFEEGDFSKWQLPNQWNCVFDKHGDGYRMRFPVKMRTLLGLFPKSHVKLGDKVVEKPRVYIEKVPIKFIKVPSSC